MQFFDSEECVWADMLVAIEGADATVKLLGINFVIESDDKELFAGGDEAFAIQPGQISKSGNIKLLKGAVDNWDAAARVAGGRSLLDIKVTIVVTFLAAPGRPVQVISLVGVKPNKLPMGWDTGATSMAVEIPYKFLRLVKSV